MARTRALSYRRPAADCGCLDDCRPPSRLRGPLGCTTMLRRDTEREQRIVEEKKRASKLPTKTGIIDYLYLYIKERRKRGNKRRKKKSPETHARREKAELKRSPKFKRYSVIILFYLHFVCISSRHTMLSYDNDGSRLRMRVCAA